MTQLLAATTTTSSEVPAGFWAVFFAIWAAVILLFLVPYVIGFWKVLEKAGRPGWGAIVPIYNNWLVIEIVGRPGWWLALLFIPYASFVFLIILMIDLAKSFGKSQAFGFGLASCRRSSCSSWASATPPTSARRSRRRAGTPPVGGYAPVVATPAGWYPDPWQQAAHRWWDGTAWTSHTG